MINKYFLAKMNIPAYLKKFLYNRYIIEGIPPITFQGNGKYLLDYRIYGASEGVGDRTKNLFDYSTVTTGYRITWTTGINQADPSAIMSDFIALSNGIYRANVSVNLIGYDINKNYIGTYNANSKSFKKEYGPKTTYYEIADNNVKFVKLLSYSSTDTLSQNTMFCIGSTILEYEPYGYKVPVMVEGKNLLQNTATSTTINGVTFTVNSDGSVTCNGTASTITYFDLNENLNSTLYAGMKASFYQSGQQASVNTFLIRIAKANRVGLQDFQMNDQVIIDNGDSLLLSIRINRGYTCDNLTFYPMIRKADIEDDTYEPYHEPTTTNIYLDEPIGENESISLSDTNVNIPTIRGTNVLTVDTTIQPSKVLIKVGV